MTAKNVSQPKTKSSWRRRLIRALILVVLGANLSAALPFVVLPQRFTHAFEVEGAVGAVLVRSIGLLFVMWVIPYVPALLAPARHRHCLTVIVVQQLVGLAGESWMWLALPPGHPALRATGMRFILFDAVGLALLGSAWWLSRRLPREP